MKRSAVKFHLIPGSLKGRAYLKRIFMGKLVALPPEITENMITYEPPVEIPVDKVNIEFKILYAIGKKWQILFEVTFLVWFCGHP
jgi:hypothetical protein